MSVTVPPVAALSTKYTLLVLGAVITLVVVSVPVIWRTAYWAVVPLMLVPVLPPAVFAKVTAPSPANVKVPAMAMSR